MSQSAARLPGDLPFSFWDDTTRYTRAYHVACGQPAAADDNPGTADRPFATISRAAQILQPGEKVVVHAGVYRECVAPARGGTGPDRMIAYEAAPGERVCITGAEPWAPVFRAHAAAPRIWYGDIPAAMVGGYNPFLATNTCIALGTYDMNWTSEERQRLLLRRGAVFAGGRPLRQVYSFKLLGDEPGTFWVEEPGLRLHLHLQEDADPRETEIEITAREQVFAPRDTHLGYLRVTGFTMECAADGVPFPQRALLSTNCGHHWIIEDNVIRRANALGIDIGRAGQQFFPPDERPAGGHIIRRNWIADCGVGGIAGVGGNDDTLVEDNLIERIGGRVPERVWESAGIKFHFSRRVLIRCNLIRRLREACGLWFDVDAQHCRMTDNVFTDIATAKGAIQMECCCHAPNRIDGNLFWNVSRAYDSEQKPAEDPWRGGFGIYADCNDRLTIDHNLFGRIQSYAVSLNLCQHDRVIGTRPGMCRHNRVLNNVFCGCTHAILFARRENNLADGNVFATPAEGMFPAEPKCPPLCIQFPEPLVRLDLDGWRDATGQDCRSLALAMDPEFDPDSLDFVWTVQADRNSAAPPPATAADVSDRDGPGPLSPDQWQVALEGGCGRQRFAAGGGFPPAQAAAVGAFASRQ